jgi:hypothetical protein
MTIFEEDLVEQRFLALESLINKSNEEVSNEMEILQQTVANLVSAYAEVTVMIEGLVANIMYEGDEAKIMAFQKSVSENREKMIAVIKNELNLDLG